MKTINKMSLGELAAFIQSHLKESGIDVILSGGACVTIYSQNKYRSYDLDFIERSSYNRKVIKCCLEKIGFYEENRYFVHKDTDYFIEFPTGPLSIGSEQVNELNTIQFETGKLILLSPTECIKDRLAAYYFWNDLQSLHQAVLVAKNNEINISEIERWSQKEGMESKFSKIKSQLIYEKIQKSGP